MISRMYTDKDLLTALEKIDLPTLIKIARQGTVCIGYWSSFTQKMGMEIISRSFFEQLEIFYKEGQITGGQIGKIFHANFSDLIFHHFFYETLFYCLHNFSDIIYRQNRHPALRLLENLWENNNISGLVLIEFFNHETFLNGEPFLVKLARTEDFEAYKKALILLERIYNREKKHASNIIFLLGKLLARAKNYAYPITEDLFYDKLKQSSVTEIILQKTEDNSFLTQFINFYAQLCADQDVTAENLVELDSNEDEKNKKRSFIALICAQHVPECIRLCINLLLFLLQNKKIDPKYVLQMIEQKGAYWNNPGNFMDRVLNTSIEIGPYANELYQFIFLMYQLQQFDLEKAANYLFNLLFRNEKNNLGSIAINPIANAPQLTDELSKMLYAACEKKSIAVDDAIDFMEKKLEKPPYTCFHLAECYRRKGDEDSILKCYDQIPTDRPTLNAEDHLLLAMFYGSHHQPDKYEAHYNLAKQLGLTDVLLEPEELQTSQNTNNNEPPQIAPPHLAMWNSPSADNATQAQYAQQSIAPGGCRDIH